jgi:hypothetical protein
MGDLLDDLVLGDLVLGDLQADLLLVHLVFGLVAVFTEGTIPQGLTGPEPDRPLADVAPDRPLVGDRVPSPADRPVSTQVTD